MAQTYLKDVLSTAAERSKTYNAIDILKSLKQGKGIFLFEVCQNVLAGSESFISISIALIEVHALKHRVFGAFKDKPCPCKI